MSIIADLCRLAKDFKSGDPQQALVLRKEAKTQSFNDLSRAIVYLMEVIGAREEQFKTLVSDNADLKELLKINGVKLDGEEGTGVAPGIEGQDGVATTGDTENSGSGANETSGTAAIGTGNDLNGAAAVS